MEKGTLIFVIFSVAVLITFLLTSWKSHAKFTAKILFEQNIATLQYVYIDGAYYDLVKRN